MNKIALALTLVSGLYITGKAKAEGTETTNTNPDSSKMRVTQLDAAEHISCEVMIAADELMSDERFSAESRKDNETSRSFLMELTSINAAKEAEEIRAIYED